jgi:ADP-heptose:LPS heptosyltransferase
MCLPIAEALKKKYPGCHITFAVNKQYSEIVEGNPFIDDIYVCKNYEQSKTNHSQHYEAITKELLELNRWDNVFQLNCLNMGFDFSRTEYHLAELYADMANVSVIDLSPVISINGSDFKIVDSFLKKNCKKNKKTILIHTRAGWDLKNWDPKKFQALADQLSKEYNVIQVGSKNDFLLKNVPKFLGDPLKPLVAIIKRADLLIGLDSGPMHIASAVDTPMIALFGSTSPPRSGPLWNSYICIQSDACCNDPCHTYDCSKKKGYNCTEEIDIRDVLKAVNKMMKRKDTIQETWWCGFVYPGRAENVFNVSPLKRALEK